MNYCLKNQKVENKKYKQRCTKYKIIFVYTYIFLDTLSIRYISIRFENSKMQISR